ncbi:uncharacterized protein LOC115940103 [Leptonychotes weddellii]|uniref:Uncharacterized protein LOC115940103 n=1 Tax=Leptonychotes weddellii TaxID=9713 RepID=A0A7F8QJ94_LEPWE|nr:uncharacterized protein LOC115940103 [Leptonychotes weddellii]
MAAENCGGSGRGRVRNCGRRNQHRDLCLSQTRGGESTNLARGPWLPPALKQPRSYQARQASDSLTQHLKSRWEKRGVSRNVDYPPGGRARVSWPKSAVLKTWFLNHQQQQPWVLGSSEDVSGSSLHHQNQKLWAEAPCVLASPSGDAEAGPRSRTTHLSWSCPPQSSQGSQPWTSNCSEHFTTSHNAPVTGTERVVPRNDFGYGILKIGTSELRNVSFPAAPAATARLALCVSLLG